MSQDTLVLKQGCITQHIPLRKHEGVCGVPFFEERLIAVKPCDGNIPAERRASNRLPRCSSGLGSSGVGAYRTGVHPSPNLLGRLHSSICGRGCQGLFVNGAVILIEPTRGKKCIFILRYVLDVP